MPVTTEQVLNALKAVQDPDLKRDLVSLGFIKDVAIQSGRDLVHGLLCEHGRVDEDMIKRDGRYQAKENVGQTKFAFE